MITALARFPELLSGETQFESCSSDFILPTHYVPLEGSIYI